MPKVKSTATRRMKAESVAEQKNRAVTPEERYRMIAEAAYFRAERRGFVGEDIAQDWLEAETEIDRLLQQKGESIASHGDEIEEQIQVAVKSETAMIADKVRAITLQALLGGGLDKEAIKRVMDAVVTGAQRGAAPLGEGGARALKEAMRGLDAALAAAAEATQLAIQEAVGRSGEFSRQGLKKTMDDLAALELLFIETLADAAESAAGFAQSTLRDLIDHACASGTAVGGRVKLALSELTHAVADTTRVQAEIGAQTLREEGALLASLAAGMLKGIAERLQSPLGNKPTHPSSAKGS